MSDELLSSYDYHLPAEHIAQTPAVPRDYSRLLVVDSPQTYYHRQFRDLPDWLQAGDLLVLNNTQVIPARLYGETEEGKAIEILLLEEQEPLCWLSLVKPGKRFKPGAGLYFPGQATQAGSAASDVPQLRATVGDRDPKTGGRWLQFELPASQLFWDLLEKLGQIPFPPYVTASQALPDQYQTIYAEQPGAVAAPTAGLHFTESLLQTLAEKGVQTSYVTLHVGVGTFRPVEVETITQHQMHPEWIDVPAVTVDKIRQTQAAGGRVIAVGTTSVRSLEGAAQIAQAKGSKVLLPYQGKTDWFIYPGYSWQVIDGMITNFHLPKSSLLMMLSALIGRERLLQLYEIAIAQNYRFYSFGDAMLILPSAWKNR